MSWSNWLWFSNLGYLQQRFFASFSSPVQKNVRGSNTKNAASFHCLSRSLEGRAYPSGVSFNKLRRRGWVISTPVSFSGSPRAHTAAKRILSLTDAMYHFPGRSRPRGFQMRLRYRRGITENVPSNTLSVRLHAWRYFGTAEMIFKRIWYSIVL